jgi:hypothetical protein
MNRVMDSHKKTVKKASKGKKAVVVKKALVEPTEEFDLENDKIKPTLVKVCELLEWLRAEVKDLREELESRTDMSEFNSLSLKVDRIDGTVYSLAEQVENIE